LEENFRNDRRTHTTSSSNCRGPCGYRFRCPPWCTLDVVQVGVVIHKLGGTTAVGMAGGDAARCMAAAGCSGQRGRSGTGQQRATAAVGGGGSPEVGD